MNNGEAMRNTLRKRNRVLKSLSESPQSKSELTNNIDVSRSTIERAIRTLQKLGCIRKESRKFYITTSGKVALDTYQDYVVATDDLTEIHEAINSLPDDIPIDSNFINGASKNIADPQVPGTALKESNELLHSATKLTGLAPLSLPSYPDLLQSKIQENGLEVELIIEQNVLDSLYQVRGEAFADFVEHENTDLSATNDSLPCAIWVMETPEGEYAGITIYNHGGVQAVLINDTKDAIHWARSVYDEYLMNSTKIKKL